MESENTTQGGNKKKFLIIALVAIVLFSGLVIFFVGTQVTPKNQVSSEEYKAQILADLEKSRPADLPPAEKARVLQQLQKSAPKPLSPAEQARVLSELQASAPQQ